MENYLNDIAFYTYIGWILAAIIIFIMMLRKYPFGKWTKENPNPYAMETMGIPRGVIRGLITISVVLMVLLFTMLQFLDGNSQSVNESTMSLLKDLLTAFHVIIAFYFGGKIMENISKNNGQQKSK